ncbi:COMM domain-containing protein 3 [Onthophagus taurus]|uniref:COMM domain-containing protein 3 n=1 Tax=Onthophagus taurus TaxID=166361 RepID=UPI000C202E58|nr:COMM domain-containing protein 3 [Onthophagus taurus]
MILSEDLKKSLSLSNNINTINDQVYKNLVEICFNELCRVTDVPNISSLNISKPDVAKEIHAAFLTLIAKAARNDLRSDTLINILSNECGFSSNRAKYLSDLYEKNRIKLQIILGNIGTHLPNIVDVKWKMDFVVKSSDVRLQEGPIFSINLITETWDKESESNKRDSIDFLCTTQELQDLVYKLLEVMRHCIKIGNER